MRDVYADALLFTEPGPSVSRTMISGCQPINPEEIEKESQALAGWLSVLEPEQALKAAIELSLRWTERACMQETQAFAQLDGMSLTGEEQAVNFLRNMLHEILLKMDLGAPGQGYPWADPAEWYPPLHQPWQNIPAQSDPVTGYQPPAQPTQSESTAPSNVYPFPNLLPQLQILCTPGQYKRIVGPQYQTRGYIPYQNQAYWQIVPKYLFARCPICEYAYYQPADTYSLRVWGGWNRLLDALYGDAVKLPGRSICSHFLGIAQFCNLHGWVPDGLDWFDQKTGEVPFVTAGLLPDQIPSYAVLHALPICRVEKDARTGEDQFVPRYTVFNLTYFAWDPKAVINLHYARQAEWAGNDPEFMPATLAPVGTKPNLEEWARRGKLGWLDTSFPALPLRIGKGLELPEHYRNITGKTRTYYWKRP